MAAWAQGDKVACALDLAIMHVQADYASRVTNVTEVFARDEARFREKWRSFAASLYERDDLQHWKRLAESRN